MRKGQKLVQYVTDSILSMGYTLTAEMVVNRIWNVPDEVFDDIMSKQE